MKKYVHFKAALCGVFATLALCLGGEAKAQRTVIGQYFLSTDFMKTIGPEKSYKVMGGEVFFGQYRDKFFWQVGVQYTPAYKGVDYGCFTGAGGALVRLIETRSRVFSLYVGGNAIFGVDFPRGRSVVGDLVVNPDTGAIDTSDEEAVPGVTKFVVGVEPRVEMEVFFLRKVALVLGAALPVKVMTQTDMVAGRAYAGFRFDF